MSPVACPSCRRVITEFGSECPTCGPTGPDGASGSRRDPAEPRGYNYDAVAALSLAIGSLLVWPLAILAVVYGLAGLRTFREQNGRSQPVQKGWWMAVTAIAVSVFVVPFVVYGVVFV